MRHQTNLRTGRKLKPASKRLSARIMTCLTPQEHRELKRAAKAQGVKISAFIRELITKNI